MKKWAGKINQIERQLEKLYETISKKEEEETAESGLKVLQQIQ